MTRALALLLGALALCGCATVNGGGSWKDGQRRMPLVPLSGSTAPGMAAPAATSWLVWTAPAYGGQCDIDTLTHLHDRQTHRVLRLRAQAPSWRPGCEANPACWDSVRAETRPDTAAWLYDVAPGARCSVSVAAGVYVVQARNGVDWSPWCKAAMRRVE